MRRNWGVLALAIALAGCGDSGPAGPGAAPSEQAERVAKNLPPPPPPPARGKAKKPSPAAEEEPAAEPEPEPQREAAKVGVSGKGNYGPGLITTPISAYFRTQERLAFLQVEQAMNLYKGEHGYFPRTEKEFFSQIIEANGIPLPKLPPGCHYVYDAQKAAKMGSNYNSDDPPLMMARQPPVAAPRSTPSEPETETPPIRLSTGVALPQTGPTGILMSFSLDYQFLRGEPGSTTQYFWVIEPKRGNSYKQSVRLDRQGTLEILIPGWRPEMGPFQTHMEDRSGHRLSASVPLQ
jgi:hypothetical protein